MAKWLFPVMNFQRGCLNSRIRSHNSDLSAIERLCPPPAFLAVSVWQQVEGWGECFPEVWISAGCTFHAYPPKSELPIHLYRISHLSPCFSAQQRWKWTLSNNKKTQANKWTNWKSLCSSDKKKQTLLSEEMLKCDWRHFGSRWAPTGRCPLPAGPGRFTSTSTVQQQIYMSDATVSTSSHPPPPFLLLLSHQQEGPPAWAWSSWFLLFLDVFFLLSQAQSSSKTELTRCYMNKVDLKWTEWGKNGPVAFAKIIWIKSRLNFAPLITGDSLNPDPFSIDGGTQGQ